MSTLFVFLLSIIAFGYSYPNSCNKGPKYWCTNYATATECGVLEFCKVEFADFNGKSKTDVKKEPVNDAPPVKIELYYESLCPGCRAFITGQLWPTFQKIYSTGIIDIALYPYGNAEERQEGQKWKFTYQHGVEECNVNLIETCALHMLSHPTQFMPYIHCIESSPSLSNARVCAEKLGIEWGPLSTCYNGTEGNQLQHEMAEKTDALNPKHQYVPWIVGNGVHTETIQENAQSDLLHYVCQTYTGIKPHACRIALSETNKCYKN